MIDIAGAVGFVQTRLAAVADPARATAMARYLKTEMPFYGVPKPLREPIKRELVKRWVPATRSGYTALVEALWALPHREEKYLALAVARKNDRFVTLSSVPLYKRLILAGTWWDLVDEAAIKLTGRVLLRQRQAMTPKVVGWLDHRNLWVRRSAIISQVGHKQATDVDLLFRCCLHLAHEKDFFIRKAIGWALRDYAWTAPAPVARFVADHEAVLAGLSKREATKNL